MLSQHAGRGALGKEVIYDECLAITVTHPVPLNTHRVRDKRFIHAYIKFVKALLSFCG